MSELTDERLAEIRARVEAATRAPWSTVADDEHEVVDRFGVLVAGNYDSEVGGIVEAADTVFIANARTDVPDLLAEVERLKGELANVQPIVDVCRAQDDDFRKWVERATLAELKAGRLDREAVQLRARVAELERQLVDKTGCLTSANRRGDKVDEWLKERGYWDEWVGYNRERSAARRALIAAVDALDAPAGHEDKASEVTG